jgi:hypothetical protein
VATRFEKLEDHKKRGAEHHEVNNSMAKSKNTI